MALLGVPIGPHKGKYRVPERRELYSRHGLSSCRVNWRVVELWQIPDEDLLQAGGVGLIPWVPLTDHRSSPETVVRRCREEIEKHAPAGEEANLPAVTQVLSFLRYNDVGLLTILGGRRIMLESPLIDELVMEKYGDLIAKKTREAHEAGRLAAREAARESIVTVLEARFGDLPLDLLERIAAVVDEKDLKQLIRATGTCPDLDAFRDLLPRE